MTLNKPTLIQGPAYSDMDASQKCVEWETE